MEFHLEHYERLTPFEKKYLPVISQESDIQRRQDISNSLAGNFTHPELSTNLVDHMNPHQSFVDSYNQRVAKENKTAQRKKSQRLYNEEGKRFGRTWDYEEFRNIHDPLRIFEKKANYCELAWKVFNDVDDSQIYLKTLYYPKLTAEHLHFLLDRFEDEFRSYNSKGRLNWILSAGSALGTWALAYKFRLKFSSFLVSTAFAFVATKFALNTLNTRTMQNNLNTIGIAVSKNYPEIKFSRVEYTKSSELTRPKLL